MDIKELEKEILETENKLEELKKLKSWMTGKKLFGVPCNTISKILREHGYSKHGWFENGKSVTIKDLRKIVIKKVSDGRTDDIQELTYDEWNSLKDILRPVIEEEIKKHQALEKEQEQKRLEAKKKHDEMYKDLIILDNQIAEITRKMQELFTNNSKDIDIFKTAEFMELKNRKRDLNDQRIQLMIEKGVKEAWHGYYKPV